MAEQPIGITEIANREHIAPNKTGDNIAAKKVANYAWNGTTWQRQPLPFFTLPYDKVIINYTDSTKATISTVVSYLSGVAQETLSYTAGTTTDTYTRS